MRWFLGTCGAADGACAPWKLRFPRSPSGDLGHPVIFQEGWVLVCLIDEAGWGKVRRAGSGAGGMTVFPNLRGEGDSLFAPGM